MHVTVKIFNAQKLRLQSLELRQWFCITKSSELRRLQTALLLSLTSRQATTTSTGVCVPELQLEQRTHLALKKKLRLKIQKQM